MVLCSMRGRCWSSSYGPLQHSSCFGNPWQQDRLHDIARAFDALPPKDENKATNHGSGNHVAERSGRLADQQHHIFDAAIFMLPHADCFFAYDEAKAAGEHRTPCVHLGENRVSAASAAASRVRACNLRRAFEHFAPTVIEVMPWNVFGTVWHQAEAHATCATKHAQLRLPSAQYVRGRECEVPRRGASATAGEAVDCLSAARSPDHGLNHQCNPGSLTLAAEHLVAMLKPLKAEKTSGEPPRAGDETTHLPVRNIGSSAHTGREWEKSETRV
jgi:hypothetical protein